MQETIRKYALENAVKFKGRANPGAIIGKLIQENPENKEKIKELQSIIQKIVKEVNSMAPEEQKKSLKDIAPEMFEKKEKAERNIFAFLRIKEGDKVVTAFPPGPEKYPHIGHAKAILLNYLLAKQYDGKFILRFEDTNPTLVKDKFYKIMLEDFEWLGVKWDELIYASDYMDLFYSHAQKLIEEGKAYMCSCTAEKMSELRKKGIACACHAKSVKENIDDWRKFEALKPGESILRLKIDMEHKNSTMRDPAIFRIIEHAHARQGVKYRIWPTYDFQNAIMDGKTGVTHRLRSKEFEMRNELQRHIQKLLGYKETNIYEIARFNLEGVESSGRKIREKIDNNELIGWDDPTLTTIRALKRRGFLPKAIADFVISTGISKSESTLTWDDFIIYNRRLLDANADRYFFVKDPVLIKIQGAPKVTIRHDIHPDYPMRGERVMKSHELFYISKKDYDALAQGQLYRLMDCLNFTKQGNNLVFDSVKYDKEKKPKILHYLPKSDELMEAEIMKPDKSIDKGLVEPNNIETNQVVQFERYGFCRLDDREDVLKFWFTHQ